MRGLPQVWVALWPRADSFSAVRMPCGPHGTGPEGAITPTCRRQPCGRWGWGRGTQQHTPGLTSSCGREFRTRARQGGRGPEEAQGGAVSAGALWGQEGGRGGGGPALTPDVLLPAPELPAAQDTQPPGLGGDRSGLASPEPQYQSRLSTNALPSVLHRLLTACRAVFGRACDGHKLGHGNGWGGRGTQREQLRGGGSGPRSGFRGSISACLPQLSDRTESLNRSIKKRYVWLLPKKDSGFFKGRQDLGFSRGAGPRVLQGEAGPRVSRGAGPRVLHGKQDPAFSKGRQDPGFSRGSSTQGSPGEAGPRVLQGKQAPEFSRGRRTQCSPGEEGPSVLQGKAGSRVLQGIRTQGSPREAGPRVLQGKAEEGVHEVEIWDPRELWQLLRVRPRS